jgi:hypothetical protein
MFEIQKMHVTDVEVMLININKQRDNIGSSLNKTIDHV